MNDIVRPITDDGLVGYDEFKQLVLHEHHGDQRHATLIADVRRKVCAICGHGWEPTGPSLADQHHWSLLEDHVHLSCFIRHLGLNERGKVFGALCDARLRFHRLVVEPNGYWPANDPWAKKPWYSAELIDHPYKLFIGMRKNVWSVELSPQGGVTCGWAEKARDAFKDENVTKDFSRSRILLHAWTDQNMHEYVALLARVGGLARPLARP